MAPGGGPVEEELFPVVEQEEVLFPVEQQHVELFPLEEHEELFPIPAVAAAPPPPQHRNRSSFRRTTTSRPVGRKRSGNAIDIIVIRGPNGKLVSTSWKASFGWSMFRSSQSSGVGEMVNVFVNDQVLDTKMTLLDKGRARFSSPDNVPPEEDLKAVLDTSTEEIHRVRFEHHRSSDNMIRYTDCRLFIWGADDSAIVADLDGTITLSDVEGHIRTLRLGQYDFMHSGACEFFTKLSRVGCRIVYLTARPVDWASASRTHLDKARQHSHCLPFGPLITNSRGLTGALVTEVVNKNPNVFKARVLNEIQMAMINAGRTIPFPIFTAGFGNRPTDTMAYQEVGIDREMIFLIDPTSVLRVVSDSTRLFESYDDPNSLMWLYPRLKRRMPLEFVEKIDLCTSEEVDRADQREEMRIAMRRAQSMGY